MCSFFAMEGGTVHGLYWYQLNSHGLVVPFALSSVHALVQRFRPKDVDSSSRPNFETFGLRV